MSFLQLNWLVKLSWMFIQVSNSLRQPWKYQSLNIDRPFHSTTETGKKGSSHPYVLQLFFHIRNNFLNSFMCWQQFSQRFLCTKTFAVSVVVWGSSRAILASGRSGRDPLNSTKLIFWQKYGYFLSSNL